MQQRVQQRLHAEASCAAGDKLWTHDYLTHATCVGQAVLRRTIDILGVALMRDAKTVQSVR